MKDVSSLILRITDRCNLQCAYCYAAHSHCPDMTPELAKEAVALCCPQGGRLSIQFTGGEPLLNLPVMEAVYAFGRETGRKLRLSVQTNGTLLTPDMCRALARMNCGVGVSLDGAGEANRLRVFPDGNPSFSAAVRGIQNLGRAGLRCNLTTVVTSANAALLGQLPDLALWLGNVTGAGLDLFRPLGRGARENHAPAEAGLSAGLNALIGRTKQVQDAGAPFRLRELERLKRRADGGCDPVYCYAQTERSMAVDGAGDCWPCSSFIGQPAYFLGNLREGLPETPRDALPLALPGKCQSCSQLDLCAGGCPAGRADHPRQPDPLLCVMQKTLAQRLSIGKEVCL